MQIIQTSAIDYAILAIYFAFVLGIGFALRRSAGHSSADFLLSGRAIPAWIAGWRLSPPISGPRK